MSRETRNAAFAKPDRPSSVLYVAEIARHTQFPRTAVG
jgi:hypothetical protein